MSYTKSTAWDGVRKLDEMKLCKGVISVFAPLLFFFLGYFFLYGHYQFQPKLHQPEYKLL